MYRHLNGHLPPRAPASPLRLGRLQIRRIFVELAAQALHQRLQLLGARLEAPGEVMESMG